MLETAQQRTWAEVNYGAIAHNVQEIQKLAGPTKIMGIVKAGAYGLGAVACAKALEQAGVDYFAVACLSEAEELRAAGIEKPVLILGYTPQASFARLAQGHFVQTIVNGEYAQKLSDWSVAHGTRLAGHIKADTGMNRSGFLVQDDADEFEQIVRAYQLPGLDVQGIFTHFPVSDDLEQDAREFTMHQMELFDNLVKRLEQAGIEPGLRHTQNSYGILNYGNAGYDYCRPGLLYMGVTSDDAVPIASSPDFIPILTLKTRVSMVKTVPAGATVSYGRTWKAKKDTKVATICIGYADGLPRLCSNQDLEVIIGGKKAPIIGRICMDQCMVNIDGIEDVQAGDEVIVIGSAGGLSCTVDTISRKARTINNETLTRLTARVPRLDGSHRGKK